MKKPPDGMPAALYQTDFIDFSGWLCWQSL